MTAHILTLPRFVFPIRIVQLVLALITLGLCGYLVTYLAYSADSLMLFISLATLIITIYVLLSSIKLHAFYNYWAVLALDIFATFFWLLSFSLLASDTAALSAVSRDYCYGGYCYKMKRDVGVGLEKRYIYGNGYTYRNVMAVASALGAVEFVLFAITLALTGLALHRHRAAGGHSLAGSAATGTTQPAIGHEDKPVEMQPGYAPASAGVHNGTQQPGAHV